MPPANYPVPLCCPFELCLYREVGMTGPVILGRAGRTPLPLEATQRETGDRNVTCGHDSFSGPGYRYSAPGKGAGPVPVPEPDNPYLIPDQPRPETRRCYCRSQRETGMYAADIGTAPAIRFPSAAPFERCLSLYSILHTRDSVIVAYAMIPFTTFAGSTPVSRKSSPW
jgi:hypothetical protein